jgi:hypothetical protein
VEHLVQLESGPGRTLSHTLETWTPQSLATLTSR